MTDQLDTRDTPVPQEEQHSGRRGHGWMMIACCIPMLVIAAVIALSGAGFGFFILAVGCTAMMAMMMGGMSHGGGQGGSSDR